MESHASIAVSAATILASMDDPDGDQLLQLLLCSIPSRQNRPDLYPLNANDTSPARLSSHQGPRNRVSTSSDDSTMDSTSKDSASGGVLSKLGSLFNKFTSIKVEDDIPLLDGIPPRPPRPDLRVYMGVIEEDELEDETPDAPSSPTVTDAEDSEMEVEFMIIADKCITAHGSTTSSSGKRSVRKSRKREQRRKRSSSKRLESPPEIKRRRQVSRIPTKPKGKQKKGIPGFL